jgi:hypothetical protein
VFVIDATSSSPLEVVRELFASMRRVWKQDELLRNRRFIRKKGSLIEVDLEGNVIDHWYSPRCWHPAGTSRDSASAVFKPVDPLQWRSAAQLARGGTQHE